MLKSLHRGPKGGGPDPLDPPPPGPATANDLLFVKQGLTKQEAYSRRLNLKLDGLPEEPNESVEQTTRKVLRFFASKHTIEQPPHTCPLP